jgi:flagellar biosynthesis protein FlhG
MTRIWPIGGGKGGSGKSFLTGNLGVWLAKRGNKTLLIDADFGGANLHTMIAVPYQPRGLSDFLNKKVQTLAEAVVETGVPNLFLISGARNNLDTANIPYELKMKIFRGVPRLSYDFILLDLGAGTSFNTLDFFLISDSGILVSTPEPTSIENVYRLIRAVYARKIRQLLRIYHFQTLLDEMGSRAKGALVQNPENLLSIIKEQDPEKGKVMEEGLRSFQFKLVLNQLRKQDDPRMGVMICRVMEKHLGLSVQFAGNIAYDERVHDAVCQKIPFVDKYPHAQAAADLKRFCEHIFAGLRMGDGSAPAGKSPEKAAEQDGSHGA